MTNAPRTSVPTTPRHRARPAAALALAAALVLGLLGLSSSPGRVVAGSSRAEAAIPGVRGHGGGGGYQLARKAGGNVLEYL